VVEGLTNREIALRLFLSERTVDGHLEHVREKLGVNTRAQIAAWIVRQGSAAGPAPGSQCIKDAVDPVRMLVTYPDFDPTHSDDPSAKSRVATFQKAYPKATAFYTFAAYDCARILIEAIARAVQGNHGAIPTRAQVVAAVARTNEFKGVTGTYSFDANGDAQNPPMSIFEVRDANWVYLRKIDARAA
jgi:ABC-type branched-subunit amino acid transport system substrate-binding protein